MHGRIFAQNLTLIFSLLISGCASTVPSFDIPKDAESGIPTVRSIADEITCEFNTLLSEQPYRDFLLGGDINVALQLSLTVNDTGAIAPSFNYVDSPFSFNAGVTLSQSREQNHLETFYYSFRQLDHDNQVAISQGSRPICRKQIDTNLAGDLGLREAVGIAIQSPNLNTAKKLSGTDGEFGGYVNFLVTKNLNMVGPTWALKHFKGPGNLGSLSEVNTDKLTWGFAQGADVGKPSTIFHDSGFIKAKSALDSTLLNQLTTQLGIVGAVIR